MIAYLKGEITHIEPGNVIIECNGVGYRVLISMHTYDKIKGQKQLKLHTFMVVREDAQLLYGFAELQEQRIFEQLIGVSGVGASTALTILSSSSPADLFQAIRMEDTVSLKRIKGIGAKTAGRIILELKDKLKIDGEFPTATDGTAGPAATAGQLKAEALMALTNLGFSRQEAGKRIDKILKSTKETLTVEEIIKLSLRNP